MFYLLHEGGMGIIRLVLALSVVLWHLPLASFRLINAHVAVVLFFIISGFYMAMVINEKYARPEDPHWIRTFYLARVWRLYPAYLAMVGIMVIWFYATNTPTALVDRLPMSAFEQAILALSNVFMIGQDLHQFLVRIRVDHAGPQFLLNTVNRIGPEVLSEMAMLVGQAWSLAAEVLFYLMAPFVVRSARSTAIALTVALAVRFALIGIFHQPSGVWGYYFFPGAVCMFLLGSASYHLGRSAPFKDVHAHVGFLALAALLTCFIWTAAKDWVVMPSASDGSIDTPRFWALYILFALSIPFIFQATKTVAFDREIGELSYPLYLVHGLVCGLVYYRWGGPKNILPDACAAVLLSLMAAYIMHRFIELPADRFRQRMSNRPLALKWGWATPANTTITGLLVGLCRVAVRSIDEKSIR